MLTILECTSIPDGYDSLFDQTLPFMDGGTFDWRYIGSPSDVAVKKAHIRQQYQTHLDNVNNHVIYWEKDGHPIHLAAGAELDGFMLWTFALYGADSGGSKGWLHDPAYIQQTRDFLRDDMGLQGYMIECHKDSSIYDYHMAKAGASETYEVSLEKEEAPAHASDVTVATIKFTYL